MGYDADHYIDNNDDNDGDNDDIDCHSFAQQKSSKICYLWVFCC